METGQVVRSKPTLPRSAGSKKRRKPPAAEEDEGGSEAEEAYNPVQCAVCETEVGLRELPPSGVYHLFNVIPSNA